jgi:hypothetical protein
MLVLLTKEVGILCSMPASRSFKYSKNNTGPRTEPCRMPWLMGLFRDRQLMILFLFVHLNVISTASSPFSRYVWNHFIATLVFPFLPSFLAIYHDRLSRMLFWQVGPHNLMFGLLPWSLRIEVVSCSCVVFCHSRLVQLIQE